MASSFDSIFNSIPKSSRLLLFAVLNKLHYLFRTGNMKFAFERMYLEDRDPWNYRYSPYELSKYQRTLSCALTWRKASASALEVGCSIGIFSAMLSEHFDKITAIDLSNEALRAATSYNRHLNNIRFYQCDMRSLALGEQYDVIFCAEVVYYIPERDAQTVCQRLVEHLSPNGVIVFVAGTAGHNPTPFCWRAALANTFQQVSIQIVDDPVRPYEIAVFSKSASV
jgi:2-polyprenyl-3-methyl-5-hydroxy-6-metoxy-1,4-benzoquinol methylase